MKKTLIAIVAGAAVLFVLGGLIYGALLAGFYEANQGSAIGINREVPIWWATRTAVTRGSTNATVIFDQLVTP